jgi:Rieske 2Fe-2S family protein
METSVSTTVAPALSPEPQSPEAQSAEPQSLEAQSLEAGRTAPPQESFLPESLIATLPGHAYTDPAYFAREQERIFEAIWFCVARAGDIATPGAFRTVQVGRESILVSRGRRGNVNAFFNICRHRGATLCTEPFGQVKRAFQCPYHAWTYDLDGLLVAAPNLTKMPDVDRVDYGLRKVAVREWLGYVWVCLAEQPPSFEETVLADVVDRLGEVAQLDHYQVESLALGRRIVYDVAANWKLIVENFMECYHCATIHPELTEVLPEFADGYAAQYYVNHGASFGDDIQGFTVDGSPGLETIPGIDADQDRKYYAITVKPQVFVNMVPDHVIVHRMYPMAPDRTVVECDWLYLPSVVESGADLTGSVELFDRVNRQDFDACERCQPAMSSRVYRDGGVLVPNEHHIARFHQWVTDRLTTDRLTTDKLSTDRSTTAGLASASEGG